jgi:hypothetical protein
LIGNGCIITVLSQEIGRYRRNCCSNGLDWKITFDFDAVMKEEDRYIGRYLHTRNKSAEIGERIVLSCLRMRSLGRYRAYTDPLGSSSNEVIICDVAKCRLLAVCIAIAFASRRVAPPHVRFSFSFSILPGSLQKLALGTVIDPSDGHFWNAWLVSAEEMKIKMGMRQGKRLSTVELAGRDAFERWICRTVRDLVERFGEM